MDARLTLVESFADLEDFMRWLGERRTWLAVDTETGGLDWWRDPLRLVQIGDPHAGWALPWDDYAGVVKEAIEQYDRPIAMHNSKFDLHFLEHNGLQFPRHLLHDTMSMVALVEPSKPKGLKPASTRLIHPSASQGDQALKYIMNKSKWTWATIPVDVPEYWQYACLDVVFTSRLAELLYPTVQQLYAPLYNVEVAVAQVLKDMETRGMRINLDFCRSTAGQIREYELSMEQWFLDNYDIKNVNSNQQVANALQKMGVPLTERTPSGKYFKIDEEILSEVTGQLVGAELADAVIDYRMWNKIRSTYLDDFAEYADGDVLHTSINPLGAITGRMSSSRPNLQNVPRSWVRSAFIPQNGNKLVLIDFDQIELRLMAHYAQEQQMIEAVLSGEDLHTFVGKLVYNTPDITAQQRQIVKAANFAKIYGAGIAKFAKTAGISFPEAAQFIQMYDARFPAIGRFIGQQTRAAREDGYVVTPYLGRRQEVFNRDKAYKIVNYFIQGTAADVLKHKLVQLSMTPVGDYMTIPIHDEVAFDVPEEHVEDVAHDAPLVMQDLDSFSIPLSVGVDVVNNWGEKYAA